jgi:hypothetical protein
MSLYQLNIEELLIGENKSEFITLLGLNLLVFAIYVLFELFEEFGVVPREFSSISLYMTVIYSLASILLAGALHLGIINSLLSGFIILSAELTQLLLSDIFSYRVVDRITPSLISLVAIALTISIIGYSLGRVGRIIYYMVLSG